MAFGKELWQSMKRDNIWKMLGTNVVVKSTGQGTTYDIYSIVKELCTWLFSCVLSWLDTGGFTLILQGYLARTGKSHDSSETTLYMGKLFTKILYELITKPHQWSMKNKTVYEFNDIYFDLFGTKPLSEPMLVNWNPGNKFLLNFNQI